MSNATFWSMLVVTLGMTAWVVAMAIRCKRRIDEWNNGSS